MATNFGDALKWRAALIMWHTGWRKGGRFTGFNPHKHEVDWEWRADNHVLFWIKPNQPGMPYLQNDRFAQVALNNIDFKSLENVVLTDPVKLDAKVIDAQVLERDNRKGSTPIEVNYSGTFSEVEHESHIFKTEVTAGIKATIGSEGAVSASVEAYMETTNSFEKAGGRDSSVERTISDTFTVPAGELFRCQGKRELAMLERTATGAIDLSHDVWVGSYQSHHLGRDRWDWTAGWNSFDAFLRVVRGEANGDLWNEFRNDKLPAEMLAELAGPTRAEVSRTYQYRDATWSRVEVL